MRALDTDAIQGDTAQGFRYMEKAAMALAETAIRLVPLPSVSSIALVCGKGNNGGDGYLAGAYLLDRGYRTVCFVLSNPKDLIGEARIAASAYDERGGELVLLTDSGPLSRLSSFSLIVDAVLGTGISGNPRGLAANAIEAMNRCGVPILAADTPSGLDNDSSMPGTPCAKATATVTMGFPKIGSFFYPARIFTGTVTVADLGYPPDLVQRYHSNIFQPGLRELAAFFPERKPSGSKFEHGLVALVSGSAGMLGSTTLAAHAALRCGCGMVHAFIPRSQVATLQTKVTEVVIHGQPETEENTLDPAALDPILAQLERMQVVCLGPGLSYQTRTVEFVRELVAQSPIPIVLDADGLNAFKGCPDLLSQHKAPLLVTPHAGEWERLFGPLPKQPLASFDRLKKVARTIHGTIIYKGNPTCVVHPDGSGYVLEFGTSALATAGSGDVLSGILASLIAQGCTPGQASLLGPCLHGETGRTAAGHNGEHGTISSDLVQYLPQATKELLNAALPPVETPPQ